MKTINKYTLRLSACALALILNPSHGIELFNGKVGNEQVKVSVGGYAKVDVRHVEGDIAYQDYWIGNFPGGEAIETSHTGFNVGESRLNMGVSIGEVSTFIEVDMYGGGGNEAVSNSTNLRLRHFFITYKNWSAGQNWIENRVDDIVVFHPLGKEQIKSIAKIQLASLRARLAEKGYKLTLSAAAMDKLADAGFDPVFGARPLKRAIQVQVENPLAHQLLAGELIPESTIRIDADDSGLFVVSN